MDDFEISYIPENQGESLPGKIVRGGARTLARVGESIAGGPGDIVNLGLGLTNYGIRKVTGKESPLPERIPLGSEEARQYITKPLTGKYLEPQTENEQYFDDVVQTAAPLFMGKLPIERTAKSLAKHAGKSLLKSGAAHGIGGLAENVSGSPVLGQGVKLGTLLYLQAPSGVKVVRDLQKQKFDQSFSNLPQDAKVNVKSELPKITDLRREISSAGEKGKAYLNKKFNEVEKIIEKPAKESIRETGILDAAGKPITEKIEGRPGGNSSVRDLINFSRGLNQDEFVNPQTQRIATSLNNIVNQAIDRYGGKHAAFSKPYHEAKELTHALKSSNILQNYFQRASEHLQDKITNPTLRSILGYGAKGTALSAVPVLAKHTGALGIGALGAASAYQAARFYQLMSKSPVALKAYKNMAVAALKDNKKVVAREAVKLNKAADDFYEQNPAVSSDANGEWEITSV